MKKITFLLCLLTLIGCRCLPQIPPQYLPANNSCEAYLPNYLEYVSVINACGDATPIQEPVPGTILSITLPHVEVTITATNSFGNTDIERFDVYLWAAPQIIWDSIPGDTIPAMAKENDIDLLIESVEQYRAHLGINDYDSIATIAATIADSITWKTLKIHYPPK